MAQQMTIDCKELEQRISIALTPGGMQSSAIADLLDELEGAIIDAEGVSRLEHERSLDPNVMPDPAEARRVAEDAAFVVGRLQTLLRRLEGVYQEVVAAERKADWEARFDELHVKRDALADEFEKALPLFNQLADLFIRMQPCDSEIRKLQLARPANVAGDLGSVELCVRELNAFSPDTPSILERTVLPAPDGNRKLWPPPRAFRSGRTVCASCPPHQDLEVSANRNSD
jgi:hypothetical protein